jgi:DNA-binding response OmpR family regulator
MKMLIVAEERGLIEALTIGLAYEWPDVRVLPATDGAAGLRQFIQEAPDLTLLDLHLRDNGGWTLLRQIREVSRAPVIVLAARGAELEEVKRQGLEPDEYLVTPFGHNQLFTRISAALRGMAEAQPAAPTTAPVSGPPAGAHMRTMAARHTPKAPARRRAAHLQHMAPRHG